MMEILGNRVKRLCFDQTGKNERLLFRLASSRHAQRFALKGAALKREAQSLELSLDELMSRLQELLDPRRFAPASWISESASPWRLDRQPPPPGVASLSGRGGGARGASLAKWQGRRPLDRAALERPSSRAKRLALSELRQSVRLRATVGPRGQVLLVWEEKNQDWALKALFHDPAGAGWQSEVTLFPAKPGWGDYDVDLAMNERGESAVLWSYSGSDETRTSISLLR
jgi:hypothetical protein